MKHLQKIAVIGGNGKTGKFVVSQLLKQGFSLKLLLRNPQEFQLENAKIEVIQGDAIDAEAIHLLLKDCQAVISTLGQRQGEPLVNSVATENILAAMNDLQIQRYILVAGLNVDTPFDKKSAKTQMATDWMKTNFPIITADRQKTYEILKRSKANWTLVRLPMIDYSEITSNIKISLEDCLGDKIGTTNIANFIIKQLTDETFVRQAPFIANA